MDWKGHKVGDTYSVQGNMLVGPEVLEAMATAFERTSGPLADRLFAALKAGDDSRDPIKELRRILDIQTAWNLGMESFKALEAGRYGEARALSRRMVALVPDEMRPLISLGMATYLDGDRQEAIELLRKARRMDEQNFKTMWGFLQAYPAVKKLMYDKELEQQVFH